MKTIPSSADASCAPRLAITRRTALLGAGAAFAYGVAEPLSARAQAANLTQETARGIAKEAYIYGFPLVDSYRIQYSYFVDRDDPEYKAPWNQLYNVARVYTPDDKSIQTPNSDTPYSFLGADLRAEPLVLSVPAIDKERYYSLQFIDTYTYDFDYVGSRATGHDAGDFLLAGPHWQGETPAGIKGVIRSETDLVFVLYRTQLFGPDDIDNVKAIQAGYKVQPLSAFLNQPRPAAAPAIDFPKPLSAEAERSDPGFYALLNFILQFGPIHPSEAEMMARFGRLGIGPGGSFDAKALPAPILEAVKAGMADAWEAFAVDKATQLDTGKKSSANGFGTRAFLGDRYLDRMSAAVLGIYGNAKDEALYPVYFVDANGRKLDGASTRYTVRIAPDGLPPVNAFWSLTLYELPASLLSANALNRYLINSPMLPGLKRDADGGITLHIQHEPPGADREANWLPAPAAPFFLVLRLYWPGPAALNGDWTAPSLAPSR